MILLAVAVRWARGGTTASRHAMPPVCSGISTATVDTTVDKGADTMKKTILKHILAIALGGAFSAVGAATVDPDHFGKSLKDAGVLAGTGAITAIVGLNTRAPKDE